MIGAGAGLSTSAGLTYSGERFTKTFGDFQAKYGVQDMYSGGFYPFETLDGFSKGCLLLPSAQAKGLLVVKLGLGQLQLLAPDLVARAFPSSITQEVGGLDVPFMA